MFFVDKSQTAIKQYKPTSVTEIPLLESDV
jgi:hypothetical protein